MYKLPISECIQRAMRGDETKSPEPMRNTLPNNDQPRIPHSEYHYISSKECAMIDGGLEE